MNLVRKRSVKTVEPIMVVPFGLVLGTLAAPRLGMDLWMVNPARSNKLVMHPLSATTEPLWGALRNPSKVLRRWLIPA